MSVNPEFRGSGSLSVIRRAIVADAFDLGNFVMVPRFTRAGIGSWHKVFKTPHSGAPSWGHG